MFSISFGALTKGKKIGEGGFGVVYKGTYHHGPAAIKQLHIDNLSPEAEEEFNQEATIMAQLHHSNVVHFYGYCTVPKCLVMEYMPKGSLFNVLHDKKQSLDWNIRIRIATDIVSGLAFLHSRNILHRDIKSLNVLLDSQNSAKLTDFGLSKVKNETKSQMTANKTSKDAVGTVQWMAPELFRRKAVYTQKSDIYSLGITLWELASRKIPYAGDTQAVIPAFVERGDREDIPTDCPEKLAYLIQQCWAGNPNARPSASDIAQFMATDAKTFKEEASKNPLLESAGHQLISQISSSFAPAYDNPLGPSLPSLNLQASPASPAVLSNVAAKRRGSEKLNLTDKEEQEKIRTVLEALRTFFREERDEGEKTENYRTYNEYLKKAHTDAELVYNAKQNKHILYVNDEPLNTEAAVKELSRMLKSLAATAAPVNHSQAANFPAVAPALKVHLPEQKNPPAVLVQFKQAAKPFPRVNASDLTAFLRLVAEGEQDKAEAMLTNNRNLALVPGDVTDLSKRTFTKITAFQYAVWALDWHMWTMIRKYLPDDAAWEQAEVFETGSWVKAQGVHAQYLLDNLVKALQRTIDLYDAQKSNEGDTTWVQQVGGAQLLLPAHVVNEYCHPTRSFYPYPNFRDAVPLPRSRRADEGEWFTARYNGGQIGQMFAVIRGQSNIPVARELLGPWWVAHGDCVGEGRTWTWMDCNSVRALSSTRTAQREELIAQLSSRNVQREAALPIAKPNSPAQKNSPQPNMLTQFQESIKPVPQLKANDLAAFLGFVTKGEQDEAEAMLQSNPALALLAADVTDLSKRTFKNITGFQYAVWALDSHMWSMIQKYLPANEARKQAEGFQAGAWVRTHGTNAKWVLEKLIKAYDTSIALCRAGKWDEANTAWVQEVGGAQLLLPVHVINEYCNPTSPFHGSSFRETTVLPRIRRIEEGEWFTAQHDGGPLGSKFAIYRATEEREWACVASNPAYYSAAMRDRASVYVLAKARAAQREELITQLRSQSIQRKTA